MNSWRSSNRLSLVRRRSFSVLNSSYSWLSTASYQFEAFCKKVINGERCDYLRELMRRSSWESSFSDLPPAILDRLYSENDDPAEYYIFRICGHVIPIRNDRLADALLTFGDEQYSILLLYYSLQLKDREIAPLLGISRSKVQRDRKTLFEELKSKMGE